MRDFRPTIFLLNDEPARILLLDDHPFVRHGISMLLGAFPITIDVAANAPYGLELVKRNKYSLMIVDYFLNDKHRDGIWFLKEVRSLMPAFNTPVLMLTMSDLKLIESKLRQFEFASVLPKNLGGEELIRSASRLLFREVLTDSAYQEQVTSCLPPDQRAS